MSICPCFSNLLAGIKLAILIVIMSGCAGFNTEHSEEAVDIYTKEMAAVGIFPLTKDNIEFLRICMRKEAEGAIAPIRDSFRRQIVEILNGKGDPFYLQPKERRLFPKEMPKDSVNETLYCHAFAHLGGAEAME